MLESAFWDVEWDVWWDVHADDCGMGQPHQVRSSQRGLLPTRPAVELLRRLTAETPLVELAAQIGLDRRTVQRVASRAWIRRDAADRLAVALGRHPSEIWLNWFPTEAR